MSSLAFNRIVDELTVHPKERIGFNKSDFDALRGDERKVIFERILGEVENGWGYSEQLKWMLGDKYASFLERRFASLPPRSHGLVFLPYFIYLETGKRDYIVKMMHEIVAAESGWDQREAAVGGYLRQLIGDEPIFWDFCRYIILNIEDISMKEDAMLWLAYQKSYPMQGLVLPEELRACVDALVKSNGIDLDARMVLDRLHSDTGQFPGSSLSP